MEAKEKVKEEILKEKELATKGTAPKIISLEEALSDEDSSEEEMESKIQEYEKWKIR